VHFAIPYFWQSSKHINEFSHLHIKRRNLYSASYVHLDQAWADFLTSRHLLCKIWQRAPSRADGWTVCAN